jgi:hypothetical protein
MVWLKKSCRMPLITEEPIRAREMRNKSNDKAMHADLRIAFANACAGGVARSGCAIRHVTTTIADHSQ